MRHGLPEGESCLRGITDFDITETGLTQMFSAAAHLNVDNIVSSPLKRCCRFAELFGQQNNVPVTIDSKWQEFNFGDWDGVEFDRLFANTECSVLTFFESPYSVTPPNGESMVEFNSRIERGLAELVELYNDKTVLCVSHAGVMKQVVALALGVSAPNAQHQQSLSFDYASVFKLTIYKDLEKRKLFYTVSL